MALTAKKEAFCNEYMIDMNCTQAAKRAGYSEKTSYSQGQRLLNNVEIEARIAELNQVRSVRTEINQDRVLLEIARLAFNDPRKAYDREGNLLPVHEWPDEVAAAIQSIKVTEVRTGDDETTAQLKEVKFWDKGKQIELAARHLNMFEKEHKSTATALSSILNDISGNTLDLPSND